MGKDILIPVVALVLIFGPRLFHEVKDYLLKRQQLKAEIELKAEALRLKNSLELEKFINSENIFNTQNYRKQAKKAEPDDSLNQKRNSQYERY